MALDAKGIVAKAAKAAAKSRGQLLTETIQKIEELGVTARFSVRRRELQVKWTTGGVLSIAPVGRAQRRGGYCPMDDEIAIVIRRALAEGGIARSEREVSAALRAIGEENREDEVAAYLQALAPTWDGTARCRTVFRELFGCTDGAWVDEASEVFLVAAAARGLSPGVMFNSVPVLEGEQQIGKTSGIRALGGEWYSSLDLSLHNSRAREEIVKRGGWIYEVEEMGSVRRADSDVVKSFVSATADEFMGKYREYVTNAPRGFVLIGTTNNETYLPDVTGNARFWPLRSRFVRVEEIRAARDLIWAEAAARWLAALAEAGGDAEAAAVRALTLGAQGKAEAAAATDERRSLTPLEEAAAELMEGIDYLHLPTLLLGPLKERGLLVGAASNQWLLSRLSSIAKGLGFSHIVKRVRDGERSLRVKIWVRPKVAQEAELATGRFVEEKAKHESSCGLLSGKDSPWRE